MSYILVDQSDFSLNADKVKIDGAEFNFDFAATENLVFNLASSLLHARHTEFDGTGCNGSEFVVAAINAVENPASRRANELALANVNTR